MDHMLVTRGAMLVILMKASWVINLYVRNLLQGGTAHSESKRRVGNFELHLEVFVCTSCTWNYSENLSLVSSAFCAQPQPKSTSQSLDSVPRIMILIANKYGEGQIVRKKLYEVHNAIYLLDKSFNQAELSGWFSWSEWSGWLG